MNRKPLGRCCLHDQQARGHSPAFHWERRISVMCGGAMSFSYEYDSSSKTEPSLGAFSVPARLPSGQLRQIGKPILHLSVFWNANRMTPAKRCSMPRSLSGAGGVPSGKRAAERGRRRLSGKTRAAEDEPVHRTEQGGKRCSSNKT